jgi:malonyl-CoA decarboxylase
MNDAPPAAAISAPSGLFDRALRRIGLVWRDMAASVGGEADDSIEAQIRACLDGRGGEVSARNRAAKLAETFESLDDAGKRAFLGTLADFDSEPAAVDTAYEAVRAAEDPAARAIATAELRRALEPPRLRLLTQFTTIPDGRKFLVDLRALLLRSRREDKRLAALELDLHGLLAAWFDIGFLELRRIDWSSPAALLEKLVDYEAVHAIRSWRDLKNRLDSDRRCYAFFHPRMPDEPLIFVEVALVQGLAGSVQRLLDEKAPVLDARRADTAIFYSISNCQKGLAGISFGNFLIKQVVELLEAELRSLRSFATLSPIPGFRTWLDPLLAEGPSNGQPADRRGGREFDLRHAGRERRARARRYHGQAQLVARTGAEQNRRPNPGTALRALPASRDDRKSSPRSSGALPSVERRTDRTDQSASRHLGERRQGKRYAHGELPV